MHVVRVFVGCFWWWWWCMERGWVAQPPCPTSPLGFPHPPTSSTSCPHMWYPRGPSGMSNKQVLLLQCVLTVCNTAATPLQHLALGLQQGVCCASLCPPLATWWPLWCDGSVARAARRTGKVGVGVFVKFRKSPLVSIAPCFQGQYLDAHPEFYKGLSGSW